MLRILPPTLAVTVAYGLLIGASGVGSAAAQGSCGNSVAVSPGDTLYWIASRCGTTVSALQQANPQVDPKSMRVGASIRMPWSSGADRHAERQPQSAPPSADTYRIRPGDTLSGIARNLGMSLSVLLGANPDVDPMYLKPGVEIRLPGHVDRGQGDGRGNRITVTGTITREGVECPALRGENGRLYTLAGDTGRFGPGDRVQVQGERAEVSSCMQGTTISVNRIRPVG